MPRKLVAGNWKMNTTLSEAIDLAGAINHAAQHESASIIICPPFPFLEPIRQQIGNARIAIGAQNCAAESKGAFTGEVSAGMLASVGVTYVIVGHSERRTLFGETDAQIRQKIGQALSNGLKVIFCCGETLEEREAGELNQVISRQIFNGLPEAIENLSENLVVAYEPVWAIGTGKTATPAQASEVHGYIRSLLLNRFGDQAKGISILYGGSCNASNAAELFAQPDIDGGLIGGASLKANDFLAISRSFA
jgi:triosephosphate isomerase